MATPSLHTDDTPTRPSDSLQAAYFRGALADQRAVIAGEIARQTRALSALATRMDTLTLSRLRRDLRTNETECRELDRMIRAIDRRFAALWADQP